MTQAVLAESREDVQICAHLEMQHRMVERFRKEVGGELGARQHKHHRQQSHHRPHWPLAHQQATVGVAAVVVRGASRGQAWQWWVREGLQVR